MGLLVVSHHILMSAHINRVFVTITAKDAKGNIHHIGQAAENVPLTSSLKILAALGPTVARKAANELRDRVDDGKTVNPAD